MLISNRKLARLINPGMQLRFVGLVILFLALYTCFAGWLCFSLLKPMATTLITMTGADSETKTIIQDTYHHLVLVLSFVLGVSLLVAGTAMFILSHRVAGAAYAINRHIQTNLLKGAYDKSIVLRKSDFLTDIADSLNELSDKLSRK